jgi:hypothetical protein
VVLQVSDHPTCGGNSSTAWNVLPNSGIQHGVKRVIPFPSLRMLLAEDIAEDTGSKVASIVCVRLTVAIHCLLACVRQTLFRRDLRLKTFKILHASTFIWCGIGWQSVPRFPIKARR